MEIITTLKKYKNNSLQTFTATTKKKEPGTDARSVNKRMSVFRQFDLPSRVLWTVEKWTEDMELRGADAMSVEIRGARKQI